MQIACIFAGLVPETLPQTRQRGCVCVLAEGQPATTATLGDEHGATHHRAAAGDLPLAITDGRDGCWWKSGRPLRSRRRWNACSPALREELLGEAGRHTLMRTVPPAGQWYGGNWKLLHATVVERRLAIRASPHRAACAANGGRRDRYRIAPHGGDVGHLKRAVFGVVLPAEGRFGAHAARRWRHGPLVAHGDGCLCLCRFISRATWRACFPCAPAGAMLGGADRTGAYQLALHCSAAYAARLRDCRIGMCGRFRQRVPRCDLRHDCWAFIAYSIGGLPR